METIIHTGCLSLDRLIAKEFFKIPQSSYISGHVMRIRDQYAHARDRDYPAILAMQIHDDNKVAAAVVNMRFSFRWNKSGESIGTMDSLTMSWAETRKLIITLVSNVGKYSCDFDIVFATTDRIPDLPMHVSSNTRQYKSTISRVTLLPEVACSIVYALNFSMEITEGLFGDIQPLTGNMLLEEFVRKHPILITDILTPALFNVE